MNKSHTTAEAITELVEAPPPPGMERCFTTQELQRDPLGFIAENVQRYGPIFGYTANGTRAVIVNTPEGVKRVLQDNNRNYTKDDTPDMGMLRPVLGEGLLTTSGPVWFQQRRMMAPAFHRQRIDAFADVITSAAHDMIEQWQAAGPAVDVDVTEDFTRLTLRIVAKALFSSDVHDTDGSFARAVSTINDFMGNFNIEDVALVGGKPSPRLRAFGIALQTLKRVMHTIVGQRRASHEHFDDLLAMMLEARDEDTSEGLNDRQICDQIITMVMAGHETTAKGLAWVVHMLNEHPDVAAQLVQAVDDVVGQRVVSVVDLARMPIVTQVIEETLRLYPPVWLISRTALEDDVIGGFRVPARALVCISPYAIHHSPAVWDQPERFQPERFAGEAAHSQPAFAYMPFSGGPRMCIGHAFALLELQLVLVTLTQHTRLRVLPGQTIVPEALVTLRPKYGLRVMPMARVESPHAVPVI